MMSGSSFTRRIRLPCSSEHSEKAFESSVGIRSGKPNPRFLPATSGTLLLSKGDPLLKYGQIIGFATQEIHLGDHVHVHNLGMGDFGRDYRIGEAFRPLQRTTREEPLTFMGFDRGPGRRSGTRNYLAIISSVNCSASVSKYIAQHFQGRGFSAAIFLMSME